MGKYANADDDISVTDTKSKITHESRARFDSLLRALGDQEQESGRHLHKNENNVIICRDNGKIE
jgi:hypothetical protein